MHRKIEADHMRGLLNEALSVLCKAKLSYEVDVKIEGLVGFTIDNNEIFLVNINEKITKPLSENVSARNESQAGT